MDRQTNGQAFIETAERAIAEGTHANYLPLNVPRLKHVRCSDIAIEKGS